MDIVSILRIALRALARNKMRSSLTMLGIIIGVAAVIAMVAYGQGAQRRVQDQISASEKMPPTSRALLPERASSG